MSCKLTHDQRLAIALDRPAFPWKTLILGFSIGQYVFENLLASRQYTVLQQKTPPKALEGEVSQEVFDKSQVRSMLQTMYFLCSLFSGIWPSQGKVRIRCWSLFSAPEHRIHPLRPPPEDVGSHRLMDPLIRTC